MAMQRRFGMMVAMGALLPQLCQAACSTSDLTSTAVEEITLEQVDAYTTCLETACEDMDWAVLNHFTNSQYADVVALLSCTFLGNVLQGVGCSTVLAGETATLGEVSITLAQYMPGRLSNLTFGNACRTSTQCPVQPCPCTGCKEHITTTATSTTTVTTTTLADTTTTSTTTVTNSTTGGVGSEDNVSEASALHTPILTVAAAIATAIFAATASR
eukprot:CAMPEP_0178410898 /NCGR_PEP_ID=MMETSP0689_2-20121128/21220_1 /TAXON_ID=160604 /ORGANISM="Amphidinium massartii, Strain CS-259" /LENGTH=214 /DNA_ID=CAMNT_0020032095 /DNA_START=123 /DNA_END=767 /DNA_ORIENTATION=+